MTEPVSPDTIPARPRAERAAATAARIAFRWMRAATETRSLVLAAILVRLLAAWSSPALLNDSVSLVRGARRVLAEGPGALLDLPHHPLPPALFALFGTLAGPETAATVVVAVASGLAVWPLHSLARRACGRHAATAACILYVALPKAVGIGSVPLAEGLFLPFFLGALALAAAARDAGSRLPRRLVGAGLLAGLAYLCRPEGLVALPAALAAAALDGRPGRLRRAVFVTAGFLVLAAPYVALLSAHRGGLALTPKKDVVRFVGGAEPRVGLPTVPAPVEARDGPAAVAAGPIEVVRGVGRALDSAMTVPVAALVLIGLLGPRRWRRRRARRPRLLLAGTALLLLLLLVRLRAGWGYASGRHAIAVSVLLLGFAGQGLATLGAVLPRVTSRRRFAIVGAVVVALPLGTRALVRPAGEGGIGARRLGEAVATATDPPGTLRIASVAEPLVAYYADRGLRDRGGGAADVPLWGRFARPLAQGAPLDEVADALATELRAGADWIVLDVTPPGDDGPSVSLRLAGALRKRGVLDVPATSVGCPLAAFRVRR